MNPQVRPAEPAVALVASLLPDGFRADPQGGDPRLGEAGAYALVLRLAAPVRFARRSLGGDLPAGWYAYAGSARGPGGMGARLRRHFRRDKAVHWHIDELTGTAAELHAVALPGGSECALADRLIATGRFVPALAGFGSSDCPRCTAHLLRLVDPG